MLKHRETYEIMTPAQVGVPQSTLVLGKHSGRHALGKRLADLGFELGKEDLEKAYDRFKVLADKKKEIFDEDLEAIVEDEVYKMEEVYSLTYLQAVSGTGGASHGNRRNHRRRQGDNRFLQRRRPR